MPEFSGKMGGCLVQEVAMARATDVSESARRDDVACLVCEAFRRRIGAERYAVWFGDAARVEVLGRSALQGDRETDQKGCEEGVCVAIGLAGDCAHDWLRRTFQADFEDSAREVCGRSVRVVWQSAAGVSQEADASSSADANPARGSADPGDANESGRGRKGLSGTTGMVIANGPPISSRTAGMMAVRTAGTEAGGSRAGRTVRGAGKGDDKPVASPAGGRRQPPGLESFVVGPSNRMAFAAVELAASRPGEMSPLVLHGPSGVGKTHLLEGICGLARRENPGQSTLFLSAEQFTTSFLQALHGSGLPGFRRTCRGVDLLVIDDLQFFVGKRATLMELQHTVDALHRQGKQMVFAADREIEALAELGPDLVTRLRGGMNARILPPDYDVRRGIVAAIASRRGLALPEEVVHYIASHMTRHARELAGAVNRLEATSHMLGLPITLEMAGEALSDLVRSSARSVRLADIERAVCSAFGIDSGSLKSARRGKTVNHPRMLAMFLARKHTASALAEIGSYFGRRSHSTVISAQKTVQDWVASGSQILLAEATWDVEEAIRRVEDVLRAG
jgi:chromosomal replication initiator protein